VARVELVFTTVVAATVTLSFYDFETGALLAQCLGEVDPTRLTDGQEVRVDFVMPKLLFAAGVYTVGVMVTPVGASRPVAWRFGRTTLYVQGGNHSQGVFIQPFECRVLPSPRAADVLRLA
jgi:hypothetical protein